MSFLDAVLQLIQHMQMFKLLVAVLDGAELLFLALFT
jgi:hypothetical protein